ncbi:type I-F CRISPR-associated protein Csy3 [Candidatus Magnetaquicoccus inordinatus]|uniref:type I-F CRISPR-associated protein Csy3 n=1 Tax=Candidatus Magnetaquicoccus inordinatus TaxID=2496818 RepID=UPI00102C5EAA|nr:type I-F CRISPR-associated protein Csy3 [Candidatus Magnetaquicoccus inordinatus]
MTATPAKQDLAKQTPSILSYQRSLVPTDGLFYAVDAQQNRRAVAVLSKTILGTESQFDATGQSKPTGNPQRVEYATLPVECEQLGISFALTVLGESRKPQACDLPEWRAALIRMVDGYVAADGFRTLGALYAANLANGRWAWKNRLFAQEFAVQIQCGQQQWHFNAFEHALADLEGSLRQPQVQTLGERIAQGLRGEEVVRLQVTGLLNVGRGATVYPSQEFASKDDSVDAIGKVLFGIEAMGCGRCAAFHEQKIGNAIRTVDIWHAGAEGVERGTPLPINPYGQDREAYVVVRKSGSGNSDFYTSLKKGITSFAAEFAKGISGDAHFVIANLVRGGVFGMGKKQKPESK